MLDYTNFDDVFGVAPFPYTRRTIQEIEAQRQDLDGVLFVDRVIAALGITNSKAYPPKSESGLRALHQQICDTEISAHHRLSIFYYILLDYEDSESRDADNDMAEEFSRHAGVPAKYKIMMQGLWFMDHQQFEDALEYITHPSLTSDFADPILTTLVSHAEPAVALQYYHTVRPVLSSADAITALFTTIAQTSVAQAFFFSRTFPEHLREQLLQHLVASVLGHDDVVMSDDQADSNTEAVLNGERARELALLPFDSVEETWFEDYIERGEGKKLRWAKDVLVIRRVASGKFAEAKAIEGLGPQWTAILAGFR